MPDGFQSAAQDSEVVFDGAAVDPVPRTFNPRLTEKGFQAGGEGEAFAATKWRKQDGNLESIHQGEYSRFAI